MTTAPNVQARLDTRSPSDRPGEAFVPLDCTRCSLHAGRVQVVPAEGGTHPLAFFVGEAPGPDEDAQGRPFIGRAGKILRRALGDAGWRAEDVWITNVVKCFPNDVVEGRRRIRKPSADEVEACRGHFASEFAALRPRLAVALGRTAAEALLGHPVAKLSEVRGKTLPGGAAGVPVFVTYHPSGLHYGHATEEEFTEDLRRARAFALAT